MTAIKMADHMITKMVTKGPLYPNWNFEVSYVSFNLTLCWFNLIFQKPSLREIIFSSFIGKNHNNIRPKNIRKPLRYLHESSMKEKWNAKVASKSNLVSLFETFNSLSVCLWSKKLINASCGWIGLRVQNSTLKGQSSSLSNEAFHPWSVCKPRLFREYLRISQRWPLTKTLSEVEKEKKHKCINQIFAESRLNYSHR